MLVYLDRRQQSILKDFYVYSTGFNTPLLFTEKCSLKNLFLNRDQKIPKLSIWANSFLILWLKYLNNLIGSANKLILYFYWINNSPFLFKMFIWEITLIKKQH